MFIVIYVHYSYTIISCTFGALRKLFNFGIMRRATFKV